MHVEIDTEGKAWKDIKIATGEDDRTIIVRAVAIYHTLLEQTSDNVIVILREDGKRVHLGLNETAEKLLRESGIKMEERGEP